jgi:metal-responsive CopG/Arc/MetJ family transcriptional regulator
MQAMSEHTTQIVARLPRELVEEIDRTAREDARSTRTDQMAYLLRMGLAGRQRLAELERKTVQAVAGSASAATRAASDHLRRHAELGGFSTRSKETNRDR